MSAPMSERDPAAGDPGRPAGGGPADRGREAPGRADDRASGSCARWSGIAIVLLIDWFPTSAASSARRDRHRLRRPADLLGADLRARDDGGDLLRRPLPRQARATCATARRSTATRGSRSSG